MLGVVNKQMALGVPLNELVRQSTWKPALAIGQKQLGNLSVGSTADLAVLRLETGDFGLLDSAVRPAPGRSQADLRDDPPRRPDRLRAERPLPARMDGPAQDLPDLRPSDLGRHLELRPEPRRDPHGADLAADPQPHPSSDHPDQRETVP